MKSSRRTSLSLTLRRPSPWRDWTTYTSLPRTLANGRALCSPSSKSRSSWGLRAASRARATRSPKSWASSRAKRHRSLAAMVVSGSRRRSKPARRAARPVPSMVLDARHGFLGRQPGLRIDPVCNTHLRLGLLGRFAHLDGALAVEFHVLHGLQQGGEGAEFLAAFLVLPIEAIGPLEDAGGVVVGQGQGRSEEHTSELQSPLNLVC